MILVYRPELQNPPMDKECTLGFSFVKGGGLSTHVNIPSGVNRNFAVDVWDAIKAYDTVKDMLSLGALRVMEDDAEEATEAAPASTNIATIAVAAAMELIEASFDVEQLRQWDEADSRIKVKNSIAKRIAAITEGKG